MLQRTACIILCALLWFSCSKKDIKFFHDKFLQCEVERMDGPAPFNIRMIGGMKKTYNEHGLVDRLYTRLYTDMTGHVDSMKYEFTYSGNVVHVKAVYQNYKLDHGPDGGYSGNAGEPRGDSWSNEFDIVLDRKTGNAISSGIMNFNYKNGRLVSFTYDGSNTVYPFVYDNKGNIIREPGAKFEYDYLRTAKKQQYFSTGHHELYTIVELLGWIPASGNNLRTKYTYILEGYDREVVVGNFEITDHILDRQGRLTGYILIGHPVTNKWKCGQTELKGKNTK